MKISNVMKKICPFLSQTNLYELELLNRGESTGLLLLFPIPAQQG